MDVTIKQECGRCKRTSQKDVTIEEAVRIDEAGKSDHEQALNLADNLRNILEQADFCPDLLVAVKNGDGTVVVKSIVSLCSNDKRGGCKKRVDTLVKDLFLENPPKPKKAAAEEDGGESGE